jgi:hypothetical protein
MMHIIHKLALKMLGDSMIGFQLSRREIYCDVSTSREAVSACLQGSPPASTPPATRSGTAPTRSAHPGLCVLAVIRGVDDFGVTWRPVDCAESVDSSAGAKPQNGAPTGKMRVDWIGPENGAPPCLYHYTKKGWQTPPMRICGSIV